MTSTLHMLAYEGVFTPGARCMLLYHDKLTPADLICALNGYCFDWDKRMTSVYQRKEVKHLT